MFEVRHVGTMNANTNGSSRHLPKIWLNCAGGGEIGRQWYEGMFRLAQVRICARVLIVVFRRTKWRKIFVQEEHFQRFRRCRSLAYQ
jgi:hypothetical protein